jgi:hypothetical protein
MSATTYPVPCACGATLDVPGSAAGTAVTCRCGRSVEVPSLAALKSAAGQPVLSADLELQHLVARRALPLERDCVLCSVPTDHAVPISVVCERPEETGHVPVWQQLLLMWVSIVLWAAHMASRRHEVHGRDVAFHLPVRVCEPCGVGLSGTAALRDALARTPVYDRLLQKYPHARLSRVRS